jgi:hypothetical protein
MRNHKPLKFVDEQRSTLSTTPLVADRVFNLDLVEGGTIIEFNKESITNGTLLWVVVVYTESAVFDTVDLGTKSIDARISGRGICTVRIYEANCELSSERLQTY